MIERAIENWLTNTNERNYQTPFCQVLLRKGHRIIYVSSHRPMEQGKNIITIDASQECCAYQLKTGDIELKKWREISGEVKELIELPVVHPSVDKAKIHKSFLITNGEITDEVRIQIDQINDDNKRKGRNYSYLDVITGKGLLKEFIEAQGGFVPTELSDFSLFLKLFLADGNDFLPKEDYFAFLERTCFADTTGSKSHHINAISSSVILTSYSLNTYQDKDNYYALFEAWTSLAGCMVRYAQKTGLSQKDWEESYNLVMAEIVKNLSLLKEETLIRIDFLEGDWRGDGELVYKIRATIVLGALATLEIHLHKTDKGYQKNDKILELIKSNIGMITFWAESAFPFYAGIIQYLELCGESSAAYSILTQLFSELVVLGTSDKGGMPNVYYGPNEILESILKISETELELNEFRGCSYILGPLIMMLARRKLRKILEEAWRRGTRIQLNEFKPDNTEDIFTWRLKAGTNHSEFPKFTQSWAELEKDASSLDKVPDLYWRHLSLLRFFILVCPHRATNQVISLLDS